MNPIPIYSQPFVHTHKVYNYIHHHNYITIVSQSICLLFNTMSDVDCFDGDEEQNEDVFGNDEELDKFFEDIDGDWVSNNNNEVTYSVSEYSNLFNTLRQPNTMRSAKKKDNNTKQGSTQSLQNHNKVGQHGISKVKQQVETSDESKRRLTNKIQQILARRNAQPIKPQPQQKTFIASNFQQELVRKRLDSLNAKKKRKRAVVTRQVIQKAKIAFQYYNASADKPSGERITFKQISQKLGVSITQITKLYDEYSQDPLFSSRFKKFEETEKYTIGPPGTQSHTLNTQRLKFIAELVKLDGSISEREVTRRINLEEELLQRDSQGQKIPVTRKLVATLMKIGGYENKKVLLPPQRNINSPEFISYRYRYVRRYLELTDDPDSDIYFLGEYSLANMASLSSCSSTRRQTFVDYFQLKKNGSQGREVKDMKRQIIMAKDKGEDRWGRNVQYLTVMSLQGVAYYQIFTNIFKELNFNKTLNNIAKAIVSRNRHMKKYLILQTSFLHKKQDLQAIQQSFPIKVIFLPPQTPMLNPTEFLFNQLRSVIRSKVYKTKRSYADVLMEFLEMYRERNLQSCYYCIAPYVKLALEQQPFK